MENMYAFFSGMVLLLLFLEPMLKLTGTDGMITKLYEGKSGKRRSGRKELLQKLYESADLTEILPEISDIRGRSRRKKPEKSIGNPGCRSGGNSH